MDVCPALTKASAPGLTRRVPAPGPARTGAPIPSSSPDWGKKAGAVAGVSASMSARADEEHGLSFSITAATRTHAVKNKLAVDDAADRGSSSPLTGPMPRAGRGM